MTAATLEKPRLTLGFVALNDCAPLVVAQEKGWFAAQGLEVTLARQPSWAAVRDRLAVGALDAAQMLATMPLAMSLGLEALAEPVITAFCLGLGGNAITVSDRLWRRMVALEPAESAANPVSARALKAVIEARRAAGEPRPVFAVVYPVSEHDYLLRLWLSDAGIDPDADIDLTVVPPPRMAEALAAGTVDGCCVGEPWNTVSVRAGCGHILALGGDVAPGLPGKVLGVTRAWAEARPVTHAALLRALAGAAAWIDRPENRLETARILSSAPYLDLPFEMAAAALSGACQLRPGQPLRHHPDFHVFHRGDANLPQAGHGAWILDQMARWGQLPGPVDRTAVLAATYRADLYRAALEPPPTVDTMPHR